MESRKQMTFYVSFWDAVNTLSRKDQLPVFRAVVSYGLFGAHEEKLTASQNALFTLMKPVLDASHRKSVSGKQGGSKPKANSKQTESKPKANGRKNEREVEVEIENEIEIENECYARAEGEGFESFWQAYPRKEGRQKALEAFASVDAPLPVLLSAVASQSASRQWQKEDGAFIPMPAKWLEERRWEDETPTPSDGKRTLDDDEKAAIQRMMTDTEEEHE